MGQVAGASPARYLSDEDIRNRIPVLVVWEITLACDLKCLHCGSRAGARRKAELTTTECLEVVDALAKLGTREISLIGGEAYLRSDWLEIVRAIRAHDIYCAIQTGGRNMTSERLNAAIAAGLNGLGVSLDGLEALHDRVRNVSGSYAKATDTLRRAHYAGLATSVNTQIGVDTMEDLPALMDVIIDLGAKQWQVQLTVAMGNAVDNDDLLLQPYQLLKLMPILADLYQRAAERGLLLIVGNNIGYYGPYEHLWRGFGDERVHWTGCGAGQNLLALEADGTVKGCPSLATLDFAGGNVRELALDEIWKASDQVKLGQLGSAETMWGFCRTCYYSDVCGGGCTWTAHSLLGVPGNNPYCHYRALELEKSGLRERISKIRDAAKTSFAIGEFELITERISDGSIVDSSRTALHPAPGDTQQVESQTGRSSVRLSLCRACNSYILSSEQTCPHCSADIASAAEQFLLEKHRRDTLIADIKRRLAPRREAAENIFSEP